MNIEKENYPTKTRDGKVVAGIIILGIGAILLLQNISNILFPDWLLSPPTFVIIFGLYIGAKNNFKTVGWALIVFIGCVFLLDDIFPFIHLDRFKFPLILICVGLYTIAGRRHKWNREQWQNWAQNKRRYKNRDYNTNWDATDATSAEDLGAMKEDTDTHAFKSDSYFHGYSDDYLDTVAVFGSVKKTILSKTFKGGEIVNVFGGAELDFTQADINGRVVLDVTQIFGGIKLIVPPHWQVVSDLAAIFSGNDDKRRPGTIPLSTDKILVIKGVSIFAGIDIRSF